MNHAIPQLLALYSLGHNALISLTIYEGINHILVPKRVRWLMDENEVRNQYSKLRLVRRY